MIDKRTEVLLLKYSDAKPVDPTRPETLCYWVTPGGEVRPGESYEAAVARELEEETGLHGVEVGPWVWSRTRELLYNGELRIQVERYYVVYVAKVTCSMQNRTPEEAIVQQRWWSLAEMRKSDELLLPRGFAELVEPLLLKRLPETPIEINEDR